MTVAPEIEGRARSSSTSATASCSPSDTRRAGYAEAGRGAGVGGLPFHAPVQRHDAALHHRDPGVVGAALTSVDATAELIADGIHVHPAALRMAVSAMPHRIALITDAMRACGLADGTYKLYDHDVTVGGGAARLRDGTLAGSVLTMDGAVRNMIELAGLPLETVLPMATEVPARILGAANRKGKLADGYDADVVILSPELAVERVFVRGREQETGLVVCSKLPLWKCRRSCWKGSIASINRGRPKSPLRMGSTQIPLKRTTARSRPSAGAGTRSRRLQPLSLTPSRRISRPAAGRT